MWDLNTLKRINQKAVELGKAGLPERSAVFLATGNTDPVYPYLKPEDAKPARLVTHREVEDFLDRVYG